MRTDVNNRWSSGTKGEDQWIYVDHRKVRNIDQLEVYGQEIGNVPKIYEIQYTASETPDGWQKIDAQAETKDTEMGQWAKFSFDAVEARYLRVCIPAQENLTRYDNCSIWGDHGV